MSGVLSMVDGRPAYHHGSIAGPARVGGIETNDNGAFLSCVNGLSYRCRRGGAPGSGKNDHDRCDQQEPDESDDDQATSATWPARQPERTFEVSQHDVGHRRVHGVCIGDLLRDAVAGRRGLRQVVGVQVVEHQVCRTESELTPGAAADRPGHDAGHDVLRSGGAVVVSHRVRPSGVAENRRRNHPVDVAAAVSDGLRVPRSHGQC